MKILIQKPSQINTFLGISMTRSEHHLNGSYYTYHKKEGNDCVFISTTGQSVSPRAFWEIELPDGKTHAQHMIEAGIDVICLDPVGYGKSTEFRNYDRTGYSKQIMDVMHSLKVPYRNKAVFGMCATTAPALLAGFDHSEYFNKVIIHSPCILEDKEIPVHVDPSATIHNMTFNIFKNDRLKGMSDRMVKGKPNGHFRFENFDNNFKKVVGEHWDGPYQTVNDFQTYWARNRHHGFIKNDKVEILSVIGEFDAEVYMDDWAIDGFKMFKKMFPKAKYIAIPDSTHFSMWEKNCDILRNEMIEFIKK